MTGAVDEELIGPGRVARELDVTLDTVTRWADAGLLKTYRTPGGHRRHRRAEVAELAAADLVTAGDAARLLGVHIQTVYRLVKAGQLTRAPWPGAQHRFRRTDVLALRTDPDAPVQEG